ncbi:MAG: hypothetical protein VX768_08110 [Planctomycetota bacterium]|nr:hypothetical protein [Planctomycetota bacterium]
MARVWKPGIWIGIGVCSLFGTALVHVVYRSVISGPVFYRQAISLSTGESRRLGDLLEESLLEMHNTAVREEKWSLSFTDAELNGWISNHLKKKYSRYVPSGLDHLCVRFGEERIHVAFQVTRFWIPAVVEIQLVPFITAEEKKIGIRLETVKSGLFPLSNKRIVEQLNAAVPRSRLNWTTDSGQPLGLVEPRFEMADGIKRQIRVENISIQENRLILSGTAMDSGG